MVMRDRPEADEPGIIGETEEDGSPVVFKLVDELPPADIRQTFPWLTVVSWKYDGCARNGMPSELVMSQMVALEHAIDGALELPGFCRHAYSRTGNGLKELAYYIHDRDQFMDAFNTALAEHPPYPIEINFYEDRDWTDFRTIRDRFT
jgi:hypothetical protein